MFGDPEYNSRKLPIYKLASLCKVSSSKRIYQSEQSEEGVPFLRISDLSKRIDNGMDDWDLYIPNKKYMELAAENLVPVQGDIFVTSRGTLGKCYIIKENDKFYFQDDMISWLSCFDEKVNSVYIFFIARNPEANRRTASRFYSGIFINCDAPKIGYYVS